MPSRQTSITTYQNMHNGQERSGSTALNEQHGNTLPTGLQNLDTSPTIEETSIVHNDQTQGQIELDANDVNSGDQNVTPPTMTQDRDTVPSTEHWPSHARICRTRPEDDGVQKLRRACPQSVSLWMARRNCGIYKIHQKIQRKFCESQMRGWKSTLHATYKCYNTDELRRRNKPDDVGVEEWDYLMEYFGTDAKFQRNPETGQEPDDIELWELGHLKIGLWSNTESQAVHVGKPLEKTALGTRNSYAHGRGYMARPLFSQSLRSQMSEQVIATSETQRRNAELRNQVRSLQDRNQGLDQHIQGLDEQNKDLVDQVQTLGYKNEELNGQVQSLEGQMEKDRAERLKEMEIFKESIRQEMTKMIASHSSVAAGKAKAPNKFSAAVSSVLIVLGKEVQKKSLLEFIRVTPQQQQQAF
ncbi:hypothetical protein U9M48_039730 [Paspalum notatum var. saurae]|uniref:Transposase n=1 Tax=Paspalum notatum var. saurae TaxID=547442 RepID=A0AAQ3ULW4_PASNO